jgi:mannose-6-phosphate isomerase-like protein (cupin superfamily)
MTEYIKAYEYEKNVNPQLKNVPITQKNINDCDFGITFINFSDLFNVKYECTTPNLLASFIKIKENENINFENNGTSHLFYILNGNCKIIIDSEEIILSTGDILVTPLFILLNIKNNSNSELNI